MIDMPQDTTISISFIFSAISIIGVIVTIVTTLKKNQENETAKQLEIEKNFVKINLKIDQFCETTNRILKQQEKSNDDLKLISERSIQADEKIDTLFRNFADHEKRLRELEGGAK